MQFQKISIPTLREVNRNFNVGDLKELFFKQKYEAKLEFP